MKYLLLIALCVLLCNDAVQAQEHHFHGKVLDNVSGGPLFGATLIWANTSVGTTTEPDGSFHLDGPPSWPAVLVTSFVGMQRDSTAYSGPPAGELVIKLKSLDLDEVDIVAREKSSNVNTIDPIHVEHVAAKELEKAACCNLSESFDTNASVDVQASDAVSGTRKIRMLGLDGSYTQILQEGLPLVRGLASSYGLTYIPGTWPESIQIAKGTGSVINGYEAITGRINIEMQKPDDADRFFLNLYSNQRGRLEANAHKAWQFNNKWSTMVFAHASDVSQVNDINNDGFLDMPLRRQYNIYNRWKYFGEHLRAQIGVRALSDRVQGGQTDFEYDRDYATTNRYGVGVDALQAEVWTKTGILFPKRQGTSIGIQTSSRYHEQEMYFGTNTYSGRQGRVWVNSMLQSRIRTTDHKYVVGASFLLDDYQEQFRDTAFSRQELVPGVFGEYTYSGNEKFSAVVGARTDFHNLFGVKVNPSVALRYSPSALFALRFSGGKGFRMPNVFAEQASVLASSRAIVVQSGIKPEEAWNTGLSATWKFSLLGMESSLVADYFYTHFLNKLIVDREEFGIVRFYNLNGKAYAHSSQVELTVEPIERLEFKTAYKWYDIRSTFNGVLKSQPLVPRHRAFLNAGYATDHDKWKFDATVQWVGQARIPYIPDHLPPAIARHQSDDYVLINAQVSKRYKRWTVYLGAENIAGYVQSNPIIAADQPFGADFDAALVWGPVRGRVIYSGLRYKFK